MVAAANPFVGQNQNAEYRAQRMADQLRRGCAGCPYSSDKQADFRGG